VTDPEKTVRIGREIVREDDEFRDLLASRQWVMSGVRTCWCVVATRPTPSSWRASGWCNRPSGVPADLTAVILRCMDKQPSNRFQTAEALAAALSACDCVGRWGEAEATEWWRVHDAPS